MTSRAERERDAFEAVLAKDRFDGVTRQVFADWLDEHGFDDEAEFQRSWTREWQDARDWFELFADSITEWMDWEDGVTAVKYKAVTVEQVIKSAKDWIENGSYSCLSGLGFTAEDAMNDEETVALFWKHFENYTRTIVADKYKYTGGVFSCSC